jgi:flagellar basal body-associated protein FliL
MDKTERINKFINITLLVFVILACAAYMYIALPTFFKEEENLIEQQPPATTTPVVTAEEKKTVLHEVTDTVEVDEQGLLNVLKSMPKNNSGKNLTEKEKMNILEGI